MLLNKHFNVIGTEIISSEWWSMIQPNYGKRFANLLVSSKQLTVLNRFGNYLVI